MATLTEAYKNKIRLAESLYSRSHDGEKMDSHKKAVLAQVMANTEKFLGESFTASQGTQRAAMGDYKRFCVNLTNVALPNLIGTDLVMTYPMTSITGYITYLKFTAGLTKGETAQDTVFNDPFRLGTPDANYTADKVVETLTAGTGNVLAWTPVVAGKFENAGVKYDAVVTAKADGSKTYVYVNPADKKLYTSFTAPSTYASEYSATADDKVAYLYDNIIIPQEDIPSIKAELANIPLFAHARRIAIHFSQIAAFQASTDYQINLEDELSAKAVGQLQWEIDTEIINLLDETAGTAATELQWSRTLPVGVSKRDHYFGFSEVLEIANQKIYDATKRFVGNWMVIASDIKPILCMIDGFKAASTSNVNGPYLAGTLNGMKVYVSPALATGRFLIGVNNNELQASVAVYAPYMAIVPTMLLEGPDGHNMQGFSTLYDLKVLNPDLVVAGQVA